MNELPHNQRHMEINTKRTKSKLGKGYEAEAYGPALGELITF